MKIDDFAPLIEFIATISAGFVAIEYVKSYTRVLCEKIFQYESFICKAYDECRALLTDTDTLDHIEPINIDGKSTNDAVEKLKVDHENLRKEIHSEEDKQRKIIIEASQSKSLSSVCFYVFLSSIVLLWGNSFEPLWERQVHFFFFVYCILSILYLVCAWVFGEKESMHKLLNFSSLRHSFICFITIPLITSLISMLLYLKMDTSILILVNSFWFIAMIIYIVLSYLNFAVFAWKINKQAKRFRDGVNSSKEMMLKRCTEKRGEVQDLLAVARVNGRLSI